MKSQKIKIKIINHIVWKKKGKKREFNVLIQTSVVICVEKVGHNCHSTCQCPKLYRIISYFEFGNGLDWIDHIV